MKHLALSFVVLPLIAALSSCRSDSSDRSLADSSAAPVVAADAAPSAGLAINSPNPSEHFQAVMSQLDVGGKALHYSDHEGRREFWIAVLELIFDFAKMNDSSFELPQGFDAGKLVDESGMTAAAASGRSISKDGEMWLLRQYMYYPNGLSHMGEFMGAPKPFQSGKRLTAATDIALEARFNAGSFPANMRKSAKMMGTTEEVEKSLSQKLPIGMTLEQLLGLCEVDLLMGIELKDTNNPEMPVLPDQWMMELTTNKALVAALKPMVVDTMGEAKAIGDHQGWMLPVPPDAGFGEPVLIIENDAAIRIASSPAYLSSWAGSGSKLGDDSTYQSATNHFPQAGNFQVYLSPEVPAAASKWMKVVIAQDEEALPMAKIVGKLTPDKPWAVCVTTQEKGILTLAEMPFAMDASPSATAVALGMTSTLFIGARAWKKGSDRAACILNQRNIQQAIRGHQNMNNLNIGATINWDEIFGPDGYMKEPTCPLGGTYSYLRTYPELGVLACGGCSIKEHQLSKEQTQDW